MRLIYALVVQITVRGTKKHSDLLQGFYAFHGALCRFKDHRTPFEFEPIKDEQYFCMTQKHFVSMYNLVKGDTPEVIMLKMTKVHNDFFRNLSDADGNLFREAKSQRQLTERSEGAIRFPPYVCGRMMILCYSQLRLFMV